MKKGTQSRVSVVSVPPQILAGQDFLSNGTQCTQKNRKNVDAISTNAYKDRKNKIL